MPPIRVEIDGFDSTLEFPEGTSLEVIEKAAKREITAATPIREFLGRGIQQGVLGLESTVVGLAGLVTGSEPLLELAGELKEDAASFAPLIPTFGESLEEVGFTEALGRQFNIRKLAFQAGSILPGLVPTILGGGVGGFVGRKVGEKAVKTGVKNAVARKLAQRGGAIGGLAGVTAFGGTQEGVPVGLEVLEATGSRGAALKATAETTLAVGALETLGLGRLLRAFPAGMKRQALSLIERIAVEQFTESAEEPVQEFIKLINGVEDASVRQGLINALEVFPIAGLFGGGISVVGGGVRTALERKAGTGPLTGKQRKALAEIDVDTDILAEEELELLQKTLVLDEIQEIAAGINQEDPGARLSMREVVEVMLDEESGLSQASRNQLQALASRRSKEIQAEAEVPITGDLVSQADVLRLIERTPMELEDRKALRRLPEDLEKISSRGVFTVATEKQIEGRAKKFERREEESLEQLDIIQFTPEERRILVDQFIEDDIESADAVTSFLEVGVSQLARAAGMKPREFFDLTVERPTAEALPETPERGELKFQVDRKTRELSGRVLFRALTGSDTSTALHEFGHFSVLTAKNQLKAKIELGARSFTGGKSIAQWQVADHERFALALESYFLAGGKTDPKLQSAFDLIKDRMQRIYRTVTASSKERKIMAKLMPVELRRTYDQLFSMTPNWSGGRRETGRVTKVAIENLENLTFFQEGKKEGKRDRRRRIKGVYKSINFDKFADQDKLSKRANKVLGDLVDAQMFETPSQPLDELILRASEELSSKDQTELRKLMSIFKEGDPFSIFASVALSSELIAQFKTFMAYRRAGASPELTEDFRRHLDELLKARRNVNSFGGRLMSSFRVTSVPLDVINVLFQMENELTDQQWQEFFELDPTDLRALNNFEKSLRSSRAAKLFNGFWFNSMLLNPVTFGRNMISNTYHLAQLTGDQVAEAAIERIWAKATGRQPELYLGGSWKFFTTMVSKKGLFSRKALDDALSALYNDDISQYQTRWNQELGTTVTKDFEDALGRLGKLGTTKFQLAKLANFGSRAMIAMDLWFQAVAEEAMMAEQERNRQIAVARGDEAVLAFGAKLLSEEQNQPLTGLAEALAGVREDKDVNIDSLTGKLTVKKRKVKLTELQKQQRRIDLLMENRAKRFAELAVFKDEPGKITKALLGLRRSANELVPLPLPRALRGAAQIDPVTGEVTNPVAHIPLGTIFVPFLTIGVNLMRRSTEFVPGIGVISSLTTKRTLAETLNKQIQGLAVIGALMLMVSRDLITGSPPDDPEDRDEFFGLGKKPRSIFIPGVGYLEYGAVEPLSTFVVAVVDTLNAWNKEWRDLQDPSIKPKLTDPSFAPIDDFWLDKEGPLLEMTRAAADVFIDSTFMSSILDYTGDSASAWSRAANRTASTFVPYSSLWRTLDKSSEAYRTGEVAIRNKTFMSTMGEVLPPLLGESLLADPRLDVFGRTVSRKVGEPEKIFNFMREWLPLKFHPLESDPVDDMLAVLRKYPKPPQQKVSVSTLGTADLLLDEDLYLEYVKESGALLYSLLLDLTKQSDVKKAIDSKEPSEIATILQTISGLVETSRLEPRDKATKLQLKRNKGLIPATQAFPQDVTLPPEAFQDVVQ